MLSGVAARLRAHSTPHLDITPFWVLARDFEPSAQLVSQQNLAAGRHTHESPGLYVLILMVTETSPTA
jgi:hypothetical protein